ncbi:restriction endonuclease subunit S [Flavobacteriaceae bacterium]|nr:restriction endonuclease subunit S [Flavobacteriaceae bacterium]
MGGLLEKISEELQIDKSQWIPTKFGDVAIQQKGKVDRDNTDLTRYVQGGHMNSEDLHLRSWGELEDEYLGPAFIRRFDEGDILYGSRRTYLRKVVIAPFSGITSNTTFVIRANEKNIDKRLLPFIMMSEGFTENSVRNSKGSVNPYINWKDIAKYEFLLPPKDQQAQLAKLLWAMDDLIEKEISIKNKLKVTLNAFIRKIFTNEIISNSDKETVKCKSLFQTKWEERSFPVNWKPMKLKEALESTQNGFAEGKRDENGTAQLRMNNVTSDGRIDLEKVAMIPLRNNIERYLIFDDDVLFCNTNSEDLVGKCILATSEIKDFSFSNHFTRLRGRQELITQKFLYLWLKFHFDIGLFEQLCTKWIGQAAVQTESLVRLQIVIPPINEQEHAGNYCQKIEDNIDVLTVKIDNSKSLQKSLINQIF